MSAKAAAIRTLGKAALVVFNQYTASVNDKIQLPAVPQVFPGCKTTALTAPRTKRAAAPLKQGYNRCGTYRRQFLNANCLRTNLANDSAKQFNGLFYEQIRVYSLTNI